MKNWMRYLMLGIVALFIGVLLSRGADKKEEAKNERGTVATKSATGGRTARRNAEISEFTRLPLTEGGEDNWLRWVAELENASIGDLPRFQESLTRENDTARRLLVERWLDLDPEAGLQYFVERFEEGEMGVKFGDQEVGFMREFFRLWADRDVREAIAAVEGVKSFPHLNEIHKVLGPALAKSDPEEALRYGLRQGLHRSGYYFFVSGKSLRNLIRKDPVVTAELMFEWGESSSKQARELIKIWSKSDPKKAIAFGLGRSESAGGRFADEVFQAWAKRDYEGASDWVAEEASEKEALLFTAPLVEVWAEDQPVAALSWAEEKLTGEVLQESAKRIILGALEKEENDVGELLQVVQSSEVHHEVVVALAEKLWGTGASQSRPKADRELHLERLAWFDHVTDQRSLNQLAEYFTRATSEVGTEWLEGFASSSRMSLLDRNGASSVLRNLAREGDYERSFEMMEFVDERYQRSVASDVFVTWLRRDLEASIVWMDEVANEEWRPQLTRAVTDEFFSNLRGDSVESFRQLAEKYPVQVKELVRDELRRMQLIYSASDFEGEAPEVSFDEILNVLSE